MNDTIKSMSGLAGIVEENLEYTLGLLASSEESEEKYKKEFHPGAFKKLKAEIRNGLSGRTSDEIIRTATFTAIMENIYSSTNEIKSDTAELVKHPQVNFDLSAAVLGMSGIVKKAVDGFFTGEANPGLKSEIDTMHTLLNDIFKTLSGMSGGNRKEGGRAIYYSAVASLLKSITRDLSLLPYL